MTRDHTIETRRGAVSGTWTPARAKARAALLLAHGAGADKDHASMVGLSESLAGAGFATLRFNFPYKEAGRKSPDRAPVLIEVWQDVRDWAAGSREAKGMPLLAGGRSMGGRIATMAAAQPESFAVNGLVLFAYPLHPPGRPEKLRTEHLPSVTVPMLFLSGTRDGFATADLMETATAALPTATLHWIDGADHGFKVLKRSGRTFEDVMEETAATVTEWSERVLP